MSQVIEIKKEIISTKINIYDILIKTNDNGVCDLYMNILYNISNSILSQLNKQLQINGTITGGKRIKKLSKKLTKRNKKIKRLKKTKSNKRIKKTTSLKELKELQKGGGIISVLLFIIILYSLGNTISGIISISDENVIKRIEETKSVINIFDNTHGWCIALQAILNKKFSFKDYITKEIKIDWELSSFQYKLTKPNLRGSIDNIDIYTSSIRNLMIILKNDVHNLDSNVGIITAFSYPTYTNGINHMVILWLTQDDHLILIDPQTYAHDDIRIYSNGRH